MKTHRLHIKHISTTHNYNQSLHFPLKVILNKQEYGKYHISKL